MVIIEESIIQIKSQSKVDFRKDFMAKVKWFRIEIQLEFKLEPKCFQKDYQLVIIMVK